MSEHEDFSKVFNQAELSMGTDMYQANVEAVRAQRDHCLADAELSKSSKIDLEKRLEISVTETNSRINNHKAMVGLLALSTTSVLLALLPPVTIYAYRVAFGGM